MQLKNSFIIKSNYSGKSKFDFWHNLKPGDLINISLELKKPGYNQTYNRQYATTLIVSHNGADFIDSLTAISKYLDKIEVEPYE